MSTVDVAILTLFLGVTAITGFRAARHPGRRSDEYLLADRSLGLPAFVVSLVATWYGGVLGVGEYSYRFGLSNWIVMGVPYYIAALVFAVVLAGRVRISAEYTVPDLLFETYGRTAGVLGATTVFALSLPAAYLLMLGVLLRRLTGWSQAWCVALSAAFCLSYIAARGFRAVVRTKWLQFTLMYGGFALLLPVAAAGSGGMDFLLRRLPPSHFTWLGGRSPAFVLAWYVIALQTLVEPTFYQRCFAARSPATARRGILVALLFFALFDGLTTFTGLYARAILPDLPSPVDAFPALGERLLPPALLGIFYAGLAATVMSTVDSFLMVGGVTFGRDLMWRVRGDRIDQVAWSRAGLVAAAVLSAAIAVVSESVVALWYGFYSVGTATLLAPLLGVFYPKVRPLPRYATWGMALSGSSTFLWHAGGILSGHAPFAGVEPIYVGLVLSAASTAAGVRAARRNAIEG